MMRRLFREAGDVAQAWQNEEIGDHTEEILGTEMHPRRVTFLENRLHSRVRNIR